MLNKLITFFKDNPTKQENLDFIANDFLKIGDFKNFFIIMEKGYIVPNEIISTHILKLEESEIKEKILKHILKNKNKQYKDFFELYAKKYIKEYLSGKWLINEVEIKHYNKKEKFAANSEIISRIYFSGNEKISISSIKDSEMINVSMFVLNNLDDKFEFNKEELFKYIENNKNNIDVFQKKHEKDIENNGETIEILNLLFKNKRILDGLYLKFLKNNNKIGHDNFEIKRSLLINDLDLSIKEMVFKIDKIYKDVLDCGVDNEKIFIANKIYKETMVQILERYTEMNISDRENIKDRNNKNAKDLLSESLNEISQILNKIIEEENAKKSINNLAEMNVGINYLKNIKRDM